MSIGFVILAAGEGTRMGSDRPTVLHPLGRAPLLAHVLSVAAEVDEDGGGPVVVVTGAGAAAVEAAVSELHPGASCVRQPERRGTAHAVIQALPALEGFRGRVLILYGDTPLIRAGTLRAMLAAPAAVTVLGFEAADPTGYGRLVTGPGGLERIVEERDATAAERALTLCNSGVVCAEADVLRDLLPRIGTANAGGEYYLTDLVGLARAAGLTVGVIACPEAETLGVNDRAGLAAAEAAFQARRRAELLAAGVTMTDPASVFLALDTVIGADTVIGPQVVFGPGVTVENGAEILPFCHLEGCHIAEGARVGPFARLRPGAELGEGARIGNFVEVKEARIGRGARVNHLAYVGDAEVGEEANIGAGAITCNYDGVMKHRTRIGARAFVGSNAALVAPVAIGADALVAAGSAITADVPDGALAVARGRQAVKPGLALRLRERLRVLKAARG